MAPCGAMVVFVIRTQTSVYALSDTQTFRFLIKNSLR